MANVHVEVEVLVTGGVGIDVADPPQCEIHRSTHRALKFLQCHWESGTALTPCRQVRGSPEGSVGHSLGLARFERSRS